MASCRAWLVHYPPTTTCGDNGLPLSLDAAGQHHALLEARSTYAAEEFCTPIY
jgi:hypothetical protein